MSNKVFLDCLSRPIKVGDVLANGQRRGSHGGICVGVVRGFTDNAIIADIIAGDEHGWRGPWRRESYEFHKGRFVADYNTLITGMTEADLCQAAKISESEAPQCVGSD